MTSSLILTILLVFSFTLGRFIRRFQTPSFVFSGILYVLFGLVLGPHFGFGILSETLIEKLDPLTSLLIGITGCLLGLRLKSLLQHRSILLTGLLSAALVFLGIFLVFVFLNPYFLPADYSTVAGMPFEVFGIAFRPNFEINQLWFCLGIGATACSASLLNLGTASRKLKTDMEISLILSHLTNAVQILAIVLIGVCLASARANLTADRLHMTLAEWVIASAVSGIICGFLFSIFIGRQSNPERILLAALGTIIFASGIGLLLGISALFVCFTTGATISLASRYSEPLQKNLIRLEEPIFVLLLIISGATWTPEWSTLWFLPLIYFVVRFLLFSFVPEHIYRQLGRKKYHRLGQGLIGQDLMAVAIALSFSRQFPDLAQMFLTTLLGSIFLNDFLASPLLKRVLLDNDPSVDIETLDAKGGTP